MGEWRDWKGVRFPEELSIDEIRMDADMSTLISLKPVFSEDGQVTAGNASQVSDGASAVLIASEETPIEWGYQYWPG